jgi:hypothetical protein
MIPNLFEQVGAPLLEQVRYHLPVIGLLHHSSKPLTSYKRKIFLYDKGDFDSYRQQLTDVDWARIKSNKDELCSVTYVGSVIS